MSYFSCFKIFRSIDNKILIFIIVNAKERKNISKIAHEQNMKHNCVYQNRCKSIDFPLLGLVLVSQKSYKYAFYSNASRIKTDLDMQSNQNPSSILTYTKLFGEKILHFINKVPFRLVAMLKTERTINNHFSISCFFFSFFFLFLILSA